jgi:hypothetical protein
MTNDPRTDPFRDQLVAAAARTAASAPRRRRRRLVLVTAVALVGTAAAAGAATGVFTLADGSTAAYFTLQCTENNGQFTLTMEDGGSMSGPGSCPTTSGARIVTDAQGRKLTPVGEIGSATVGTAGAQARVAFDVLGRTADGKVVVMATTDPSHLGKSPAAIGAPPIPPAGDGSAEGGIHVTSGDSPGGRTTVTSSSGPAPAP